jgi:hypothetical protein
MSGGAQVHGDVGVVTRAGVLHGRRHDQLCPQVVTCMACLSEPINATCNIMTLYCTSTRPQQN